MKRIGTFLLALMLALAVPAPCFAAVDEKTVEAPSAVLVSAGTGAVLFEKNAHDRRSPASVTKLMTMLLVAEALDTGKIKLTDTVTGSANAASKGGSQIWLEVGEQMTVEELLKAVVIASANDACTALAEFVAGSDGAFVQCMNARAKELGLQDTHFENCTGLDDTAKKLQVVKVSEYNTRWPNEAAKVAELNELFPQEYTGDIYAAHAENTWMTYNPYQYEDKITNGA